MAGDKIPGIPGECREIQETIKREETKTLAMVPRDYGALGGIKR